MLLKLSGILPSWLMLFGPAIILSLFSTILFLFFQFIRPHKIQNVEQTQAAGVFIGLVGGFYGILLGFVIVMLWQNCDRISGRINSEADQLATILLNIKVFPEKIQKSIEQAVGNYVKIICIEEWPQMKKGRVSSKTNIAILNLFKTVAKINPQNSMQKILLQKIIESIDNIVKDRRERINSLDSAIPPSMLITLITGAFLLSIFLVNLGGVSSFIYLYVLNVGVSFSIGLCLGLMLLLALPFTGYEGISDTPFREGILEQYFTSMPLSNGTGAGTVKEMNYL